ncbi:MAG: EAL domain-containing protein [Actinomycetota bacterium]|nr:EAL domain-containing protein [Actinomycetota bacterium]
MLDRLSEVVFETDPVGNWTYLNQAWATVTGFSVAETLGNNFLSYLHPDERVGTLELFRRVILGGADSCHHETRYLTADGGYRWMELRATVLRGSNGEIVGNVGTILDITARRQAQDTLVEQSRILELIARDAPLPETLGSLAAMLAHHLDGVVSVATAPQRSSRWAWCDPVTDRATGQPIHGAMATALTAIGKPDGTVEDSLSPRVLRSLTDAQALPRSDVEIRVPRTGTVLGLFELYDVAPDTMTIAKRDLIERCTQLAAIAIERDQAEEDARHQALHDPLTGLPNRTLLGDRLAQALTAARRSRSVVALLLVDLDHFKAINDTLGHEAGDEVLCHVARRLQEQLRDADTVARMGGDEFALVLPELSVIDDAEHVAGKLLAALTGLIDLNGVTVQLSASVGIAAYPLHGDDAAALFRRADVAMYRAKRLGDEYAVYDTEIDAENLQRAGLAAELRLAIETDQLVLHYQPQINLRTGQLVGVESLVRWRHPARGLMAPDLFIPLAENTGLIKSLSWWVLRAALADCAQWQQYAPQLSVAVNCSAHVLHDRELLSVIDDGLLAGDLSTRQLQLEITESAVMADPDGALQAITRLDGAGVSFVIDDFGTGYSSLSYLKRLPVRSVKIDKSFVRDMGSDERDASIVRSAIDLAHGLGLEVIAEGVETEQSYERLIELGCDCAQGFYLARPMPGPELTDWLLARARL